MKYWLARIYVAICICAGLFGLGFAGASWAGLSHNRFQVSQKGRTFQPNTLTIERGDTIDITNDDADILHNAYVASDVFKFEAGDQEPGTTVSLTIPVAGIFTVLCAIHPKMRLQVTVK